MNIPLLTAIGAVGSVAVGLLGLWLQRRAFTETHDITEQDHTIGLMQSNIDMYDRIVEFRRQVEDCRQKLRQAQESCGE